MRFPAFLMLLLSVVPSVAFAGGSVTYGVNIEVGGGLRLIDGNLCFADSTCMSTAAVDGQTVWGEIGGLIEQQADLNQQLQSKQPLHYQIFRKWLSTDGYTPSLKTNESEWQEITEYSLPFVSMADNSYYRITYTDNIGIYSSKWCTVGLFIDNYSVPICYGSWGGSAYNLTFNQQSLSCLTDRVVDGVNEGFVPAGNHVLKVKHRSGQCYYGNYTQDDHSTYRELTIQEVN